jgi:hypothetical protein
MKDILNNTSFLLIDESPLQVLPSLAEKIGLNESILLQQLHYWLKKSEYSYDGRKWVYNTYEDWQRQFSFWSVDTIKRVFLFLEKKGIIISTAKYNKIKIDRTKWYTIDYDKLNNLSIVQNCTTMRASCPDGQGKLPPSHEGKLPPPITREEITTETTTTERLDKNAQSEGFNSEENQDVVVVDEEIKQKIKHTQFEPLLPSIALLEVIKEHGIEKVLSILDMLIYQYRDKQVDNPAGLLIKALKCGLDKPPGYVSREEKEEQEKKVKIKKQEQDDLQRRKEDEMKEWEDKFNRLDKLKQDLFLKQAKEKVPFVKNHQVIKGYAIDIFRQVNTAGVPP